MKSWQTLNIIIAQFVIYSLSLCSMEKLKQKSYLQVVRQLCESFVLQQKSYHFVRIDRTVSEYPMTVAE